MKEFERKGAISEGIVREPEEKEFQLEEAFEKLEDVVQTLEQEDISLEKSFQIYARGMELLKQCNQAIDRVEKKVLVLSEDGETHEF